MAFRYPYAFPPRGPALGLLVLLFLLPGITGHDPWKSEDVLQIATVAALLKEGHWLLPALPGLSEVFFPPLSLWLGALSAKALSFLPLHDAVRVATALAGGLLLLFLHRASLRLHGGAEDASAAVLIALGCLGLLPHIHEAHPGIFIMAGYAAVLWGVSLLPRRPLLGALVGSVGMVAAFLAYGLKGLVLTLPLFFLPWLFPGWRRREVLLGAVLAVVLGLALSAIWPLALREADLPALMAWSEEEMQALLHPSQAFGVNLWRYLTLLSWFAWPALPLALWRLWRERTRLTEPATLLPLSAFLLALVLVSACLPVRNASALVLLPPLVLLAAPAAGSLRRGAANAFDWFAMMTFTLAAALIWLGWLSMVGGVPAQIAANVARLLPGFRLEIQTWSVWAAVVLSLAWFALIVASPRRSPWRGTFHWAAGVTVLWALTMLLWLPAIDYGRSYRAMAMTLAQHLPKRMECLSSQGVGPAQVAALYYFAGIVVQSEKTAAAPSCNLLLVQSTTSTTDPGPGWKKLWEGRRVSDRTEHFGLYRQYVPHHRR